MRPAENRQVWILEKSRSLVVINLVHNYGDIIILPQHKVSLHWCEILGIEFMVSTLNEKGLI